MNLIAIACPRCGNTSEFVLPSESSSFACLSCGREFANLGIKVLRGFVYVLSNPSMPGLVKIGMTTDTVLERAAQLSAATGVPESYVVEGYVACVDPRRVEAALHERFETRRKAGREFFQVELAEALSALRDLSGRDFDFLSDQAAAHVASHERQNRVSWQGSFAQVKAECRQCGHSGWFPSHSRHKACVMCGTPYRRAT